MKTLILSIETSGEICSAALHQEGNVLASMDLLKDKSHSDKLGNLIENVLKSCQVSYADLAAIACSSGPGSYTGLRIGYSTAKGLAYGTNIPLIAVSTLETLIQGCLPFAFGNEILIPMIDARRMEVFTAQFTAKGERLGEDHAFILEPDSYSGFEESTLWFIGNGAEKYQSICSHPNAFFFSKITLSAKDVGVLAWKAFQRGAFADLIYSEPEYIKAYKAGLPSNPLNQ